MENPFRIFVFYKKFNFSIMAFFKTEKPKQFTFVPRFYDARKEELESRIGEIKKKVEAENEGQYVSNIRGQMKSRHEALYGKAGKSGKSIISRRFLTILFVGLVLLIGYLILRMLAVADKI